MGILKVGCGATGTREPAEAFTGLTLGWGGRSAGTSRVTVMSIKPVGKFLLPHLLGFVKPNNNLLAPQLGSIHLT